MKFYLTKKAQLEAEGRSTAGAKPKAAKRERSLATTPLSASPAPAVSPVPSQPSLAQSATSMSIDSTPSADVASIASADSSRRSAKSKKQPARVPKATSPKKGIIAIGGLPRVDLLPPEVRAERRAAVNVRRAWTGVVGLVVLVGLAGGTAALYSESANASLQSAQKQTGILSAQTAKYSAVKTTQNKVDLIDAARTVGGSTDIDWPSYLAKVQATLPTGMSLSTVTIDSASPVTAYIQATSPLQGQRIATLSFSATSASLPSVPAWLNNLAKLPGFADASAGNVSLASGVYTANVVVHIDQKAFSNVYAKGGK